MRRSDGITDSMDMCVSKLQELVMYWEAWRAVIHGVAKSWTIKKAEGQRIAAFQLWCWRRLLRVPWTARISNLSILKKINPEYSLEGLISFMMDWLDLLAVQETLKSLLQHRSSKALIIQCSSFFIVQFSCP